MTGTDHVLQMGQITAQEWIYTVTVINATPSTFDEIVLFYQRSDNLAVIGPLSEKLVGPGEVRIFRLCECKAMLQYAMSFYIGNVEQIRWPPPPYSNITPQLASQLDPQDTDPCADSWEIVVT